MNWFTFAIQWLHVLLGILWFGASLTTNLIFIPAINRLPLDRQREIAGIYGNIAKRILNVAGMAVIVLGILRGTVFGQIQSLDALMTTYGITWLVALLAAIGTFAWAKWMIEPRIERMNAIPIDEAITPDGKPSATMLAAVNPLKRATALELIGFFVIFTCMILMRFGL